MNHLYADTWLRIGRWVAAQDYACVPVNDTRFDSDEAYFARLAEAMRKQMAEG